MLDFIYVAIGGFVGAIFRFLISKIFNNKFPFIYLGTFLINILGSFLLGFLVNLHLHSNVNLMICIGLLGSFTTFSTFKVENLTLLQQKKYKQFVIYLFFTYTIGMIVAFIGFSFAKSFI